MIAWLRKRKINQLREEYLVTNMRLSTMETFYKNGHTGYSPDILREREKKVRLKAQLKALGVVIEEV